MTRQSSIQLTTTESAFCQLLDDFAKNLSPPVVCRIAGGWVRDKLLDLPSNDLDIALTTPSGHSFAVDFAAYLQAHDIATASVGKVAANPEQSKHLETGTTRILGLECDFVGLRSETYSDTRIPRIEPGTPLEDASRRDLTINSLFYNVHSGEIEDFTQRGLPDLRNRIARTPLPPKQTFQDDPLRVLRCIRFASRFSLSIEDETAKYMADETVKADLRAKVSKERIGIEVTKMMKHHPLRAIQLIYDHDLHSSIFQSPLNPPVDVALHAGQILDRVGADLFVDELLWLAATVAPFDGLTIIAKREQPAALVVLAEAIKLSNATATAVNDVFRTSVNFDPDLRVRSAIGIAMQKCLSWERSLTWSAVRTIISMWRGQWSPDCETVLIAFKELRHRILQEGLPQAVKQAPLINGYDVQQILGIPPSKLIQVISRDLNEWQLDHPALGRDECERWLREGWSSELGDRWRAEAPFSGDGAGKISKRKR